MLLNHQRLASRLKVTLHHWPKPKLTALPTIWHPRQQELHWCLLTWCFTQCGQAGQGRAQMLGMLINPFEIQLHAPRTYILGSRGLSLANHDCSVWPSVGMGNAHPLKPIHQPWAPAIGHTGWALLLDVVFTRVGVVCYTVWWLAMFFATNSIYIYD